MAYKRATEWFKQMKPVSSGEATNLSVEYARQRYEEYAHAFEVLDKKADDLLRLTGGGGIAFAAALKFAEVTPSAFMTLAFMAVIGSALLALVARWPARKVGPPSISDFIEDVEEYGATDVRGRLAGAYHCTIVGLRITNDRKAALILLSSTALCLALVLLIPSIAGWTGETIWSLILRLNPWT